jgi:hypothetical protein
MMEMLKQATTLKVKLMLMVGLKISLDSQLPKDFDADQGPFVYLPSDAAAYDFFEMLFPASMWELMVTESSRYAQQRNRLKGDAITVQEMKAVVGLVLAMGIHVLPRIENYWNQHWVLGVPQFAQVMTAKRFWYLWSNIHLVENGTNPCHRSRPRSFVQSEAIDVQITGHFR